MTGKTLLEEMKEELENDKNMPEVERFFEMKKEVQVLEDRLKPSIDRVFAIGDTILRGIETERKQQKFEGTFPENLPTNDIVVDSIMKEMAMENESLQKDIEKVDALFEKQREVSALERRLQSVIDRMAIVNELVFRIQQGRQQGIERGLREGIEQGRRKGRQMVVGQTAFCLLKEGIDLEFIMEVTDLSKERLLELDRQTHQNIDPA